MNPNFLDQLYHDMGAPRWFWPLVMFVLFLLFVLACSLAGDV